MARQARWLDYIEKFSLPQNFVIELRFLQKLDIKWEVCHSKVSGTSLFLNDFASYSFPTVTWNIFEPQQDNYYAFINLYRFTVS